MQLQKLGKGAILHYFCGLPNPHRVYVPGKNHDMDLSGIARLNQPALSERKHAPTRNNEVIEHAHVDQRERLL